MGVVLPMLHVLQLAGPEKVEERARQREAPFPWLLLHCADLRLAVPAREGARTPLEVAWVPWLLRYAVRQLRGLGNDDPLQGLVRVEAPLPWRLRCTFPPLNVPGKQRRVGASP